MRLRPVLIALMLLVACEEPSQHDPVKWGTVTVAFGPALDDAPPFLARQLEVLHQQLQTLRALGPDFVLETEGTAQWVLRPYVSPNCDVESGRYTPGTRYVECDPVCAQGDGELRTCFGHELGHALGLQHICRQEGEAPDCSPVGFGDALMNPAGHRTNPLDAQPVIEYTPTHLDLLEYARTHPI